MFFVLVWYLTEFERFVVEKEANNLPLWPGGVYSAAKLPRVVSVLDKFGAVLGRVLLSLVHVHGRRRLALRSLETRLQLDRLGQQRRNL